MRNFIFTLVVVGMTIIVVVGGGLSLLMEDRRRRDTRHRSAREAAARFRRRFGTNAGPAVQKMLDRPNISRRKRRFFKLIATELRDHASLAPPRPTRSLSPNSTKPGTQP
jgi:hypothetical protein